MASYYTQKNCADYNNNAMKKTEDKENMMISFIIKATAQGQDCNILISKLKREIDENFNSITLLEAENEVKAELIREKDEELEQLKMKNDELKSLLEQRRLKSLINNHNYNKTSAVLSTCSNIIASPKYQVDASTMNRQIVTPTPSGDETDTKSLLGQRRVKSSSFKNRNYKKTSAVLSTCSNIIASPKYEVDASTMNRQVVASTTSDDPDTEVTQVTKPKTGKLKRSFRRTRDLHQFSNIVYNLRRTVSRRRQINNDEQLI